ncbi:putative C6 transcription factor QutA [Aspergillus novofumigatus IBT 16806]|uniref:Putative C6 transcription factor QutA n=1 Tax=Aspergillus novofumigatus (strain IBT 16806) TaxID=1392255 RepID=A0A2I1C9A8_ASPN1|nr:putative C6 transcription factor QutA [Aspergillus novofumigatus IBT 16806]PKX94210.1 putative C6 transcription factor QutA [Aspergillus novofumigatus IBT 16806]
MSNDMRQAPGAGSGSKRRLTDTDEDARRMPVDDNSTQSKRQRVSRACDSCRSKKDKCDGVQPVCSTCASLCRPCTYKTNPKKRGLPTGYIRTLELLWGLVFCKIKGSEEVVRALLRAANMPSHLATMGKEAEGSDDLVSSWKNSAVLKDIERMLTLLDQPEEEQDKAIRGPGETDSPEAGGSSILSSDTLEWQLPEGATDARQSQTAGLSPSEMPSHGANPRHLPLRTTKDSSTQTVLRSDTIGTSTGSVLSQPFVQSQSSTLPRLPSNVWTLLDVYFSYTQCWFPILEKHDILRTAFRQSEDNAQISPRTTGSGDCAALWAVLTLASMQERSIAATRQMGASPNRPRSNQLYATARALIPAEKGIHEIGHVQALLILSLVRLGQQEWKAAWVLVGQAVRIARWLGLGSPLTGMTGNEKGSTRSKHVFLGCFVLETLVAIKTGQVPSLRKEDLVKTGPINEDGLEEWHPWEDQTGLRPPESSRGPSHRGPLHALSTFNRLISLMCILNEACCTKQLENNPAPQLEALERQLQHWVSALPKSYRVDLQSPTRLASPHIFGLEMMFESSVTALSLDTLRQSDKHMSDTRKNRAIESLKRLLLLLQKYMETYSLAATSPIFGMLLTFGISPGEGQGAPGVFELDLGLKNKLEAYSSHLSTVWLQDSDGEGAGLSLRAEDAFVPTPADRLSHVHHVDASARHLSSDSMTGHTALQPLHGSGQQEMRAIFSTPDSFLTSPWTRTPNEDNVALSLPTPSARGAAGHSNHASQLQNSTTLRPHSLNSSAPKLINDRSTIPDIPSPFPVNTPQYQQTYSDPNLHLGTFIDIEGYASLRRPRIAPDLDALFDELASLDGTEKGDNQPEFMQNLGFVPDAGLSDLYSYSSQEPFLLAQTQQLSEGSAVIHRERQPKR